MDPYPYSTEERIVLVFAGLLALFLGVHFI